MNLNFKKWMEDSIANNNGQQDDMSKILADPKLSAANAQAQQAARQAIQGKKNPIQAAQKAVLNANIPSNKLGSVLPKDPDEQDDRA
jgi:hypothetical protein